MRIAVRPEPKQHCDCHDLSLVLMTDDGDVTVDKDMSYQDAKRVAVALLQELIRNDLGDVTPYRYSDGRRQITVNV